MAVTGFQAGCIYLGLFLALTPIYTLSLIAMAKEPDLMRLSCYKFMFFIGVNEVIILYTQAFYYSLCAFTQSSLGDFVEKAASATVMAAWDGVYFGMVILALNRCLLILAPEFGTTLFEKRKRAYYWLSIAIAVDVAVMILYLMPGIGVYYDPKTNNYIFDSRMPTIILTLQYYNNVGSTCVVMFFSALMLIRLRRLRAAMSKKSDNGKERAAFVPAFFAGVTTCLINIYDVLIMPNFSVCDGWCSVASEGLSIIVAGVNGIVYVTINDTIRSRVKSMLRIGSQQNSIAPISVGYRSSDAIQRL